MDCKDKIAKIIKEWVRENFGTQEMEDPCYNIEELSKEIAKHRYEIHSIVQEEYDLEDINSEAKRMGVKLSEDDKLWVLHRYKKLEDSNLESLYYIIEEINERKK